ncbi:hypothetical protein BBJ28_00002276 [Nothophytophthora sp. Chile5]|nr:hypothetical protein BBJ28_00002276 [Nothophytophthora sp. Chile5]
MAVNALIPVTDNHLPSVTVTENVSGVRNATKRSGAPATSNLGAGSRKAARSTRSSKRRESVQSTASSSNNESSQETIAGKLKYSELAKESGWVDQELIEAIERDIVEQGEKVMFENIAGLEHTKQLLQETVMLPQIAPHLFAAVAHECGTTFFNVSASTLSSKFRGDSEKMVRILFDMARYYEPSIIFMDEIDAIASARGGATEHEASRSGRVMLLAATNLPWELDEAMRRRLTKRVYIPLPEAEARRALFELNLKRVEVGPEVKMDDLVKETQVNPPQVRALDFCCWAVCVADLDCYLPLAKRMPVKRVYTPELLLRVRRDMEGGEDLRELENERLVVTKLRTAYEFIMAPSGPTDPDPILFSENRFETTEGDFCCVRFETIQFPGVKSLKQVFDALSFYKSNMEIIISERLGHITVRDDYDTIDDYAYNTRVLSTNERGIVTEGNMVSFRHLFGEGDAGFGSETGIMAVDFVDEDALHPYISSQRVRRDVSAAIVLTASKKSKGSSSKDDDEVVVTMRRASFLKLHQPEFPLSELALEDLRDTGAEWCDVMVKTVRSIVYSTPY